MTGHLLPWLLRCIALLHFSFFMQTQQPQAVNRCLPYLTKSLYFKDQTISGCNFILTIVLTATGSLQLLYFAALIKSK